MLYQEALLRLSEGAAHYDSELPRRRRDRLREEIVGVYALLEQHGANALSGGRGVDRCSLLKSSLDLGSELRCLTDCD
jgi:hypothetical protein